MYPATCSRCGKTLTSKTQHTHHRRLCRSGMAERIAAVIDMPVGLEVREKFVDNSQLVAKRLTGLPPGKHFVVSYETGPTEMAVRSFATAAEAAAHFLTQLDYIRNEMK